MTSSSTVSSPPEESATVSSSGVVSSANVTAASSGVNMILDYIQWNSMDFSDLEPLGWHAQLYYIYCYLLRNITVFVTRHCILPIREVILVLGTRAVNQILNEFIRSRWEMTLGKTDGGRDGKPTTRTSTRASSVADLIRSAIVSYRQKWSSLRILWKKVGVARQKVKIMWTLFQKATVVKSANSSREKIIVAEAVRTDSLKPKESLLRTKSFFQQGLLMAVMLASLSWHCVSDLFIRAKESATKCTKDFTNSSTNPAEHSITDSKHPQNINAEEETTFHGISLFAFIYQDVIGSMMNTVSKPVKMFFFILVLVLESCVHLLVSFPMYIPMCLIWLVSCLVFWLVSSLLKILNLLNPLPEVWRLYYRTFHISDRHFIENVILIDSNELGDSDPYRQGRNAHRGAPWVPHNPEVKKRYLERQVGNGIRYHFRFRHLHRFFFLSIGVAVLAQVMLSWTFGSLTRLGMIVPLANSTNSFDDLLITVVVRMPVRILTFYYAMLRNVYENSMAQNMNAASLYWFRSLLMSFIWILLVCFLGKRIMQQYSRLEKQDTKCRKQICVADDDRKDCCSDVDADKGDEDSDEHGIDGMGSDDHAPDGMDSDNSMHTTDSELEGRQETSARKRKPVEADILSTENVDVSIERADVYTENREAWKVEWEQQYPSANLLLVEEYEAECNAAFQISKKQQDGGAPQDDSDTQSEHGGRLPNQGGGRNKGSNNSRGSWENYKKEIIISEDLDWSSDDEPMVERIRRQQRKKPAALAVSKPPQDTSIETILSNAYKLPILRISDACWTVFMTPLGILTITTTFLYIDLTVFGGLLYGRELLCNSIVRFLECVFFIPNYITTVIFRFLLTNIETYYTVLLLWCIVFGWRLLYRKQYCNRGMGNLSWETAKEIAEMQQKHWYLSKFLPAPNSSYKENANRNINRTKAEHDRDYNGCAAVSKGQDATRCKNPALSEEFADEDLPIKAHEDNKHTTTVGNTVEGNADDDYVKRLIEREQKASRNEKSEWDSINYCWKSKSDSSDTHDKEFLVNLFGEELHDENRDAVPYLLAKKFGYAAEEQRNDAWKDNNEGWKSNWNGNWKNDWSSSWDWWN